MVSIGLGPQDEKEVIADTPKVAGIDYEIPDHEQHRLDRRSKIDAQCDEWFTTLLGDIHDTGVCTGPITDHIRSQLLTLPPLINDIEKDDPDDEEWTPYVTTKLPWSILHPSYGLEAYGLPIPRRNAETWRNFDVTGMISQTVVDGKVRPRKSPTTNDDDTYSFERIQEELQTNGAWLSDDECAGRLIYVNGIFCPELSKQQHSTTSATALVRNLDTLEGLNEETMQFLQRLTDGFTDDLVSPVPMQTKSDAALTSYSKLSFPHHSVGAPYTQFAINTQQGSACFAALNTLKCPNIAYVHSTELSSIDDSTAKDVTFPILIVHAITNDVGVPESDVNSNVGVATHPRTVVIAEPHTNVNVVQHSVTLFSNNNNNDEVIKSRPTLKNGYTQIWVKDYANVTHTLIEETGGMAVSGIEDTDNDATRAEESVRPALLNTIFDTLDVHCAGTGSSYVGTSIGAGGNGRSRLALYVSLLKPSAQCTLRGLTLTNGLCRNDVRTCIHHIADGTTSDQLQKQMIGGRGTGSFRGRIRVEQSAQQTNSHQLSRTVLLSDKCRAVAIPSLEIIADDVKCTHGATVSDLSDEEVFYLRSRGLNVQEARNLLMYAFCNDMVDGIPDAIWLGSRSSSVPSGTDAPNTKQGLQQRIYERLQSMTPRGVRAIKGEFQSV
jgi:Fe-S cluster assembly scaffold protein SufB